MSYNVDGTKVRTLSTLVGRVLHIGLGIVGGSVIKSSVFNAKGLENEVSVTALIKQKRTNMNEIDTGVADRRRV